MFWFFALAACAQLDAEKILARHLAAVIPAFEAVSPSTVIGFSPSPGVQRTFSPDQLRGILTQHGVAADIRDPVCFEWPMAKLDIAVVRRAMLDALQNGEVEILEMSKSPVPPGEILFSRDALPSRAGTDGSVVWKGQVRFGASRHLDIWARVKVSVPLKRVVAKESLRAGEVVRAEQLTLDETNGLPDSKFAQRLEDVIGRVPRRAVPSGTAVQIPLLEEARAVAKGDLVQVEVRAGSARLVMQARAIAAGSVGSTIPIENIESKKTFIARVEAAGKVVVVR